VPGVDHLPTRERLPKRRHGITHSVEVNGAEVFMTTNQFADGRPGEVFAKWGKEGSTAGGLMDALSIVLSLALQYGVPAEVIVTKLKDLRFEPFGRTDDPDIPQATSVMDWLARRIALDHLPAAKRAQLGILATDEDQPVRRVIPAARYESSATSGSPSWTSTQPSEGKPGSAMTATQAR
jgi:ribonucleoside-diphosphate reductase alpha chain